MKNTLAENMLRFGSKNLTRENRENLKRLTEDFVYNGITYKLNFKDEATFYNFITPTANYITAAVNFEKTKQTEKNNTYRDFENLFKCLLYAFAYLGKVPGSTSRDSMLSYIKNGKAAIDSATAGVDAATAGVSNQQLVNPPRYQDAIEFIQTSQSGGPVGSTGTTDEFSERILPTSTFMVEPPTVTKAMKYIDWFNVMVFKPMIAAKSNLYTTAPAPAGAKPGVPVKKN